MKTTQVPPHRRIIIPLDVSTEVEALAIVGKLRGRVGMFKIGLQLFCAAGPDFVKRLAGMGEEIFLDLKLHDIPNTVARAVTEAARLKTSLLDIHLSGGPAMVRAAAEALKKCEPPRPSLLGITVLTSLDQQELETVGVRRPIPEQVVALARMGKEAGIEGVVASPHEIAAVKSACGPGFIVIAPGIRPRGAASDDQRRTMTPAEAVEAGADFIVIGRPVIESADPTAAVEAIALEMGG